MARITLLQLQRRRRDRVSVFLDEEFAFGISLELASGLRLGQELDDEEIAALQAEDAYRVALDRAVRFLASRPRSRRELARRLGRDEIDEATLERVLARLEELGYVDDRAFAEWWVANRAAHRPRGRLALRSELAEKGVPRDIVEEALEGQDDADAALRLAMERRERYRGLDRAGFDRRLGGYLRRRGFRYEEVRDALEEAWRALASDGVGGTGIDTRA